MRIHWEHAGVSANTSWSCSLCLWMQLWPVVGVFLMAKSLRMYATCQAQAWPHSAVANGLLGHTELRWHSPSWGISYYFYVYFQAISFFSWSFSFQNAVIFHQVFICFKQDLHNTTSQWVHLVFKADIIRIIKNFEDKFVFAGSFWIISYVQFHGWFRSLPCVHQVLFYSLLMFSVVI